VRFREDVLRGIRLFAIVFAAILVCVTVYRIAKAPSDSPAEPPDAPAAAETGSPAVAETAPEVHPLVVPEPPPVAGAPVPTRPARGPRPKNTEVPPPPPITAGAVHARKSASPAAKEFEVSTPAVSPQKEAPETAPVAAPKSGVGYKSLVDAEPVRVPVDLSAPAPTGDAGGQQVKGNRFLRALGKLFHPGKKETEPSSLEPKQ
jgi:hypothetical protein